jgi:tripartite-type tricarboxylate transporter receptor subunit TctC
MNRHLLFAVVSLGTCLTSATAWAQAFPSRPVRIVISFPAGGSTDLLARVLAERLQSRLSQPVVVDNRPGGNSVIAAEFVAKSQPDGHTLFMALDATMSLNPLLYSKLPYDPERDFTPISHIASQPYFIVASAKAPVRTFPEILAYAKANPGKLSYGTSALLQMLTGEKIKLDHGVRLLHVPFRGSPPMLQALLAGEIDFAITAVMPYATYVRDGKLFAIATSGAKRESLLPTTPVISEAGHPDLQFGNWNGLFAPAGTPEPVLARLNADVRAALSEQATVDRLVGAGIYPSPGTPEELRALMRQDVERWTRVIKAAGVKLD